MPPHTTFGHGPLVARERPAAYETAPPSGAAELPPALRELLGIATDVDRGLARMVSLLVGLQRSGEVEAETGLQVEAWLSQLGRMLRVDRTFLTVAADVLASMPATLACFGDGTLSWSQVRGIVTAVRGLRVARRAALDDEIAAAAHEFATWDPEQIVWRVDLLAAELLDTPDSDDADELLDEPDRPADTLVLQPRIDGSGGKLFGDYHDPVAFGTIENALSEQMGRPDALEPSVDDEARARNADRIGQARADALVDICAQSLAGTTDDGGSEPAKPSVIGTVSIETLLGLSHQPGQLLTRMTGGRLKVDAATIRRLIDEGGAQLRTIVLDETGQALGVGKKAYVPPGWVREAALALQHECGTPGCRVAARLCDLDHVVPWPDGGTDINGLEFQCRRNHVEKTAGVWQVTVLPDGTRRHRHVASGLTTDVPLATRPLGAPALQPPRVDPPHVEPGSEPEPAELERHRIDPPERRP